MTFEEIVGQAIDMVQRRGQVSYRMLTRQFDLDNTYLDDFKYELIEIQQIAVDQDGKMLVWTGDIASIPPPASAPNAPSTQERKPPISCTPPYLTGKILTSRSALADELGMRPLQAHCHRGLGTLYSQTGQVEYARAALSTAIAMYRDMKMTFWLPETEAALAEVEG